MQAPTAFPERRKHSGLLTKAERDIRTAIESVKAMGHSMALRQAEMLLQQAGERVADHVDLHLEALHRDG